MTDQNPFHLSSADREIPRRSELFLRVASAIVLAPLALIVTYAGGWFFLAFWCAAAIGIWWEWNRIVADRLNWVSFIIGAVAFIAFAAVAAVGEWGFGLAMLALAALSIAVASQSAERGWAAAGFLYAGCALVGPALLRTDAEFGFLALVYLFAVVWVTDIFAYFTGRALGGPKLALRLSPNKTWSGAIGGATGAVIAGVIIAAYAMSADVFALGAIALLLSIVSQAGDLFESAVKRRFDVKDTGHIIPGHGGLMDRLDGFLVAAIVAALIGVLRNGLDSAARGLLVW